MWKKVAAFLLAGLVTVGAETFSYDRPVVKTLESNGPPAGRLDLVFVSDGFTVTEEKLFQEQVQAACSYLWGTEFYSDFRKMFNVHTCFVPATRSPSGTNFPFGSSYVNEAVGTITLTRSEEAARVAQKAPGCDFVIVMSTLTGLSHGGSQIFLASKDTGAFPHELGHTLGLLGDEYNSPTRQDDRDRFKLPVSGDLQYPNLTLPAFCDVSTPEKMAKTIKWGHLFSLPDAQEVVGAFPGGYYRGDGVFRPSFTCTMRSSQSSKFCPVCHEALTRRLYQLCGMPFEHDAYHRRFPLKRWKSGLNY